MPLKRAAVMTAMLAATALRTQAQSPADAPDSSQPVMTLHANARIVVLDVVVTDGKGHPVKGLKASDFALTEDGAPQTLLSFTEHDSSIEQPAAAPAAELPQNTFATQPPITGEGAKTIIVFDNLGFADAPFARAQVKEFMKTVAPGTPMAMVRFDWQGMHLVQGLTADPRVLLEAASSKRMLPPLGFQVRYARRVGNPLQELAVFLAGIPGRVNLIWFGSAPPSGAHEGLFPDTSSKTFPDLDAFARTLREPADIRRISRVAVYPIAAGGLQAPPLCSDQACVANVSMTSALAGATCLDIKAFAISVGGKGFCNTNGFKEAISEVVSVGSDYYTVSYRPTNPNWNGKFRQIKVRVDSLDPTLTESAFDKSIDWLIHGFVDPKLQYRDGYYARDAPESAPSVLDSAATGGMGNAAAERKLISTSPKGNPGVAGHEARTRMQAAMGFGMLAPNEVNFTVVAAPTAENEVLKAGEALPKGIFLTEPFRTVPYRNYRVHYWVDPKDLSFTRSADGTYRDELQLVAMVYRDDGLVANSLATTVPFQISADDLESVQMSGVTVDQTIAVPVTGNPLPGSFFLRFGVNETSTGHVGAIEVPAEWIKLPMQPAASDVAKTP
jgi:VWFA-related protein